MHSIEIIENFISDEDCKKAIAVISELVQKDSAVLEASIEAKQGARYVYQRPEAADAIDFVKKYSEKAKEIIGTDYVVHDSIFVRMDPGSTVAVHNDFDYEDDCSSCEYAAVYYLDNDYTGGEIFFPDLGFEMRPDTGTFAYFSQKDGANLHGVNELTSGVRHMVNLCFTKNKEKLYDMYR